MDIRLVAKRVLYARTLAAYEPGSSIGTAPGRSDMDNQLLDMILQPTPEEIAEEKAPKSSKAKGPPPPRAEDINEENGVDPEGEEELEEDPDAEGGEESDEPVDDEEELEEDPDAESEDEEAEPEEDDGPADDESETTDEEPALDDENAEGDDGEWDDEVLRAEDADSEDEESSGAGEDEDGEDVRLTV
jgi:hypothetical protein